jgi:hypothetical protein
VRPEEIAAELGDQPCVSIPCPKGSADPSWLSEARGHQDRTGDRVFKWRRRERGDAVRNFVGPGRAAARRYDLVDERPRPWQFGPDVAVLAGAP